MRMVVNRSIPVQLIDQFRMAAVVVNCPPFRGQMTACHPHQLIHTRVQHPALRRCKKTRGRGSGATLGVKVAIFDAGPFRCLPVLPPTPQALHLEEDHTVVSDARSERSPPGT